MHVSLLGLRHRTPELYQPTNEVDIQAWRQFGDAPFNQQVRSHVRSQYGDRDVLEDVARIAEISPRDSIVDLGCGDGSFLVKTVIERGVTAPVVGLELSGKTVEDARAKIERIGKGKLSNIAIAEANIQDRLKLRRSSANVSTLINVVYHLGDPEKVADKMGIVTQPGERIAIVTKDVGDLGKAWEWVGLAPTWFEENYPGKYPDMKPPVPFYANCTLQETIEIFDARFERKHPKDPNSSEYIEESIRTLKMSGEHAWTDYKYVLLSICEELVPNSKDDITRFSAECRQFIEEVLRPKFDAEMTEKGYVEDEARQYVLLYRNRKPEKKLSIVKKALRLVNNDPQHTIIERAAIATKDRTAKVAKSVGKVATRD